VERWNNVQGHAPPTKKFSHALVNLLLSRGSASSQRAAQEEVP